MERTVSAEDIAKAVEIGGYPIARKYFFRSHKDIAFHLNTDAQLEELPPGVLEEACAMGIAALNLGVGANALFNELYDADGANALIILAMNDKAPVKSLKQIARFIAKTFKGVSFSIEEFDYGSIFENYKGKQV